MKSSIRVLSLCLLVSVTSCSYLHTPKALQGRDKEFLEAESIPAMKIPPGMPSNAFHTVLPVADRYNQTPVNEVSIVPPGLNE